MKIKNITTSRRFKHGSMATILTIFFVVAVVMVNVIAALVLDRMPVTVDLTDDKIYQLTEDSLDYVKNIDQKVEIIVCYPKEDLEASSKYGKQITEIIENYAKQNKNISVRWVDLLKEPNIATEYSDYGVTTYSIIVKSDKRVKVASLNDCLETQTNQQTQQQKTQSVAERVLTSAVMYVTEDAVMKASILTGHTENKIEGLTSMLNDNNYQVTEQNITTEEIDPEATVVCIYAPTTDYTSEELAKLDQFLDNNGQFDKTVIYVASYTQPELPNLASFLAEWGLAVNDGVLLETNTKNIYDQQGYLFSAGYTEEDEYREELRNQELPFLTYYSRPLSTLWEADGNRNAKILLTAPETSVIIPSNPAEDFDITKADSGKGKGVVALGTRTKYDGTTPHISKVLLVGSDGTFSQNLIGSSAFNNNEYTIGAINKMAGKESSVDIAAVSFDAEALNITQAKFNAITIVFVVVIPVLMLVLGVVVWIRRRNK